MTAAAVWPGRTANGAAYPGFVPAGGVSPTYPLFHDVLFASTAITLKWGLITNANAYEVQVSLVPDFSTTIVDAALLTAHQYSFTDSSTNDAKRYWRWRYSLDGGTSYSSWSEVGSYWLNTGAAKNITLSNVNVWAMINPSPVTDAYLIPDFPLYAIKQQHLYRVRERNRLGAMLSEYITQKAAIQLSYDAGAFLTSQAFFEYRRFNEQVKTFFLATFKSSLLQTPTPNIWKVQFDSDPELNMFAAGRQDLFAGTLTFTEV